MITDIYNEVMNGQETYNEIALVLRTDSVLVGWTDGEGSHHDVLFSLTPRKYGNIQRGLHRTGELLFVSVVGLGTFGFDIFRPGLELHPEYVGSKLGMGNNITAERLTELITGVIKAIYAPLVPIEITIE